MPAKKRKTAAKASEPRHFKVLKAFGHEGTYYAAHNAARIGDLPEFEIEDRIKRGFIVEQRIRAPATNEGE